MIKMTCRMSRRPRGGAAKRTRKWEEIKEPALVRRRRGLQRQRKQARRQVWAWKPSHGLHRCRQMSSKLLSCLLQQPL
eukprot:19222_3